MPGLFDYKEYTRPMTAREILLERIAETNRNYTDMFIMSVSMDGDQPVIQGYYEGRKHEGAEDPASLVIGSNVLRQLELAIVAANSRQEGDDDNASGEETTAH